MAKVASNDIFFRNPAITIMLNIIVRFNKDTTLVSTFSEIFK